MHTVAKLLLIMSFLSLFGCGHAPEPQTVSDGPVTLNSFYYTETHGYRGYTNRGYKADRLDDGKVRITIELGNDRDRIFVADAFVMDSLEAIVKEYKMNRYKEKYMPRFDIKDGDSWSFHLGYSDGKHVSSHGYVAKPNGAGEAFDRIESFFSHWRDQEPDGVALVSFRFELHVQEGSEVFWFKKDEFHNAVYFRPMGSFDGWNYYCGDENVLESLDKEVRWMHACSYCGEDLSQEDTARPRWIAILEYANGSKFELMDYLDRDGGYDHRPPTHTERELRYYAEKIFKQEIERIGALPPEQIGEHSCTSYDAQGKPQRTIHYDGEGRVLSGRDYNDPDLDF